MKRRDWLRWGCAHCAALGSVLPALGQTSAPASPASTPADGGWQSPDRFARPDASTDEGGLWALMDREETRLRRSPFRMRDAGLNQLLTDMACRLSGSHCPDMRVYAVRTPHFNASMAPNGMMQVWSGLLLRVDNEAQLAAVLGHEVGHYLQRHTLERLRDIRARSAFGQFMGMFGLVGLVGQLATLAGAMAFSRDQEREADRIGVVLMRRGGYDPREAAKVWGNLLDELRATPGNDPSRNSVLFASHPASDERRATLDAMTLGDSGQTGAQRYREVLAPLRGELLADEIKRGRPHESVALISRLLGQEAAASDPELLHYRAEAYRQRGNDGDALLALADCQAALATGRELPASHRLLGDLQRSAGQTQAAREAWQHYLQRAPQSPDAALVKHALEELK